MKKEKKEIRNKNGKMENSTRKRKIEKENILK
jgi:hypothetical protein